VLVTDGASDNRVLPIIESRIKINSVKYVTIKQAETLENTYFTILEKLKEPHYARIVFGIPALLILIFAISYIAGTGWEPPAAIIGLYLLIKGFGLEDALLSSFRGFGFSLDRMSFAFYLGSIIFLVASFSIGLGNYYSQLAISSNQSMAAIYGIEGFLLLLPVTLILYLIGRIIDVRSSRYLFRGFKYGSYIGSSLVLWVLLYSFVAWIIGQIYFSQLINYTIVAIVIGVAISLVASMLRTRVLKSKRLRGRLVVNELGAMIGKVDKTDIRRGRFIINTSFGNPISYNLDRIVEISDKVVIK
jgi:putative membrane protein